MTTSTILELQILLLCIQLSYLSSQRAYAKFHLRNYYGHSFHEYASLGSLNGTLHLNPKRYHGAFIENTYCYQLPLIVTQSIRNIWLAYNLTHRSKPPLTSAQAQYSLKVVIIHIPELLIAFVVLNSRASVIQVIHNRELLIASRALSSWPWVIHVIHNPELFITFGAFSSWPRIIHITRSAMMFIPSKGLSSHDSEWFISSITLSWSYHLEPWAHQMKSFMSSTSLNCS